MPARYRSVLLFGPPGVGKGTQGKCLAVVPGFHHLACGDVFRALDRATPMGQEFLKYSTRGELVPDALTIEMWKSNMNARVSSGRFDPNREILLLDGIPRNVDQAKALDASIDVLGIVHLVCSDEEEMVRRMRNRALREGRHDDADEAVIRNRFDVYRQETAPVLSHYSQAMLFTIDATGTPARVLQRVLDALVPVLEHSLAAQARA
jgi:adenylate kinase